MRDASERAAATPPSARRRERGTHEPVDSPAGSAPSGPLEARTVEADQVPGHQVTGPDQEELRLVARAVDGDQAALREVIGRLQDPLYRLALRMVGRPPDAEDAVQEILLRVVTRLSTWRGEAKLLTWAYRVGVNYLLNLRRRSPQERDQIGLDDLRDDLADGLAAVDYAGPEAALLAEEVRLSCTQAMLQCLGRDERVVFVLGEIFELTAAEAAWILGTTPAACQKRLERVKQRLAAFLRSTCGVVEPKALCRCPRRVDKAMALGRVDIGNPAFAGHRVSAGGRGVAEAAAQIHRLRDAAAVLSAHPDYAAPQAKIDAITGLLTSGRFPLLE
ncbi:RNA polymerase sigma factor [Nocardia sp. bgisy118]|uniref:RNA polymerase sigma factor n=1 Tax=Nocardia sp. bgisy118 TaxID=3413786 RepID=UPI003F49D606